MDESEILWRPPPDIRERSRIGAYLAMLEDERGLRFDSYADLWKWSVDELEAFWGSIWDHFDVIAHTEAERVLADASMPGAVWFPGATLNYAENLLRSDAAGPAIVTRSQTRGPLDLTTAELRDAVARARQGLARLGVGRGDRVAAYLPNIAETVVAFLATASLGAVWSSCAPEFGIRSVVDRFGQIEPKVLLGIDGYRYGTKDVDRRSELDAIRGALPSLEATVVVPYRDPDARIEGAMTWDELCAHAAPLDFEAVPFAHPLYVLYSSGTTGLPKPIVHCHGGILVEHLKILALHHDLGRGDRFFWFSTTGWMMWNYLVSGLAVGSAIVLFDGDPASPDLTALWSMAAETGTTLFGTSAPFLMACRKEGLRPRAAADLSALRGVGSTGAPLPAEGFRWVYDAVSRDVLLASVSGGTDVCTAFVGASPLVPVRAGEIACRCLGARVEAYDAAGRSIVDETGELVVTAPMPSMPIGFWGDADGSRLRQAYFDEFPGVWSHGDWIRIGADGTCVITGRSDSTLNRGGVRLGTSDFYSVVEAMPEIADSLVVHLEDAEGGAGELLLFVQLQPGSELSDTLRRAIATALRTALSPRHVPDAVVAVPAVPRTLSGKKLEVPVKRILAGMDPERAAALGALADPAALDPFAAMARERGR
ncbi:MAG: acetoacetate--CoA ligase [Acidimicrobiia bacterium]|nr:acetoacetate--CoA ligase [Acidimicrobiia bacterium]